MLKGTDLDQCQQAIRPMQRGWKHLAKGATNYEIDRAKNSLRTNLFSQLETNTQLANYVATEVAVDSQMQDFNVKYLQVLTTNQIVPLDVLDSKIHFISADTVRKAVDDHVYDREVACAGIGLWQIIFMKLGNGENQVFNIKLTKKKISIAVGWKQSSFLKVESKHGHCTRKFAML